VKRIATAGKEKGAAMVEFAIVLPLLLTLIFGIIEFGLLLYNKAVITNASREGARAGIVFSDYSNPISVSKAQTAVTKYISDNLISFGSDTPTVAITGTCSSKGTDFIVTVGYDYTFLVVPNFIISLADKIHLEGETIMRCE
jgi:Flp pilus assembly protein TadG